MPDRTAYREASYTTRATRGGLQVAHYDAKSLSDALGEFELADNFAQAHRTPWGARQHFQFSRFNRSEGIAAVALPA
jgi:hypothetical protein